MSNESVKLFDESAGMALAAQQDAAAVARATQEIQAALVIAQRFPRNEVKAKAAILSACQRKELAEVSEYEYSRGGTRITGPTIDLLRAVANRWGNVRFGWAETERIDGQSTLRAYAWDLQTNSQAERTFKVRHWRDTQAGGYLIKEERDIYEMLANQAARRVRACLEEVIDSDVVDAAIEQCRKTLREGEKTPLADRAVQMVTAFAEWGVTQAMIEVKLGNKLEAVSENQLASLRRIYKSLKDGVGTREDYFKPEMVKPDIQYPLGYNPGVQPTAAPLTPPTPQPAPAPEKESPLKMLRSALKSRKFTEAEAIGYLRSTGSVEDSLNSLEEILMVKPSVIEGLIGSWGEFASKIEALKKGAK